MTTATDHYEDTAREALDAADGSGFVLWHDERIGETWAPLLGGEHQDPLHRSNLEAALDILAEHVEAGDVEEGTVARSGATWLTLLLVRVRDDDGLVTRAWIDTVDQVLGPLEDYPVLDEDRYSELEHEELIETVEYAAGDPGLAAALLERLESSHPDDYDHEAEVYALAVDLETGADDRVLDEDARDALATELRRLRGRTRGRHYRPRPAEVARGLVAETLAERIELTLEEV